ncbi:MAG TPA: methyltransferase domain-containing protein [Jatrophihabitantaceae bacterium]|nr:methyltransferase domain-containing protein [Jatrophihabitantaceae bacterium]
MTGTPDQHGGAARFDYDAELHRYHERLRAAVDIGIADCVLDIGCGTGQTTRDAARAAPSGSALGVDVSAPMLAEARRLSQGLRNISFVQADAQVHRFAPEQFDIAISRFGTMFFADPVAAFTNIGRALRPGGRLVQLVWQHRDRQEWDAAIRGVFGDSHPAPGADPFSLADPATTDGILAAAGFTGVDVTGVHEPIYYGPDTASALDAVLNLKMTKDPLARLDAAQTDSALDRLRAALAAHDTGRGVYFDSHAWIVTARRSG